MNKTNKHFTQNLVVRMSATYLFLVCFGLLLLYVVHCVPFSSIRKNVETSCKLIGQERFYNVLYHDYHFHLNIHRGQMVYLLDGLSDAVMLMETYNIREKDHLRASMANDRILLKEGQLSFDVIAEYSSMLNDKNVVLYSYGRYWHGYLVTLIPALTIMDLSQIRILNCILFFFLIVTVAYLAYKRINIATSIAFLITFTFSLFFPIVPYSLQFSSVFYIALIASFLILLFSVYWMHRIRSYVFFFAIGAITSYFDLLTAPIVTLGFPLAFYGLMKKNPSYKDLLAICFFWTVGYGMMWVSKWLLSYLLVGLNVFDTAAEHAMTWTGADGHGTSIFQLFGLIAIQLPFFFKVLFFIIIVTLICAPKRKTNIRKDLWLLLIMFIPIFWLLLIKQHTTIHFWFSWRNLTVSFFALLLFTFKITDFTRIKNILYSRYSNITKDNNEKY